jgi:hypothetical protein
VANEKLGRSITPRTIGDRRGMWIKLHSLRVAGKSSAFLIAEPSIGCNIQIGKLASYLATAVHPIFPEVANPRGDMRL